MYAGVERHEGQSCWRAEVPKTEDRSVGLGTSVSRTRFEKLAYTSNGLLASPSHATAFQGARS